MYGALLEDLKLALERNRADAALIQDLGASLSAYEDKLSLATARRADNISSNQNQDDPDDEDVEPASVFVRWHRGLLRVKGKLSTRHFRRYLLAKIEAFSAARAARKSLLNSLLQQQQVQSEAESRSEDHIHELSLRLRDLSHELDQTTAVASQAQEMQRRGMELQASLASILSIASSQANALNEKDEKIKRLESELEESRRTAVTIKGLEWKLDKAWNELAAERLKSISHERSARAARKTLEDHLENEQWKKRVITYSHSNSSSNLAGPGGDNPFARRSVRHSSPGDGARRLVTHDDCEDGGLDKKNDNKREGGGARTSERLPVSPLIQDGSAYNHRELGGLRVSGKRKSLLSEALLASCPNSPAASDRKSKSIFAPSESNHSQNNSNNIGGGECGEVGTKVKEEVERNAKKADKLSVKTNLALPPAALVQPKFTRPSVILEEPSAHLDLSSTSIQDLMTITTTSPPSGPHDVMVLVGIGKEGGEGGEGGGDGGNVEQPEGASLPQPTAHEGIVGIRALSSDLHKIVD